MALHDKALTARALQKSQWIHRGLFPFVNRQLLTPVRHILIELGSKLAGIVGVCTSILSGHFPLGIYTFIAKGYFCGRFNGLLHKFDDLIKDIHLYGKLAVVGKGQCFGTIQSYLKLFPFAILHSDNVTDDFIAVVTGGTYTI